MKNAANIYLIAANKSHNATSLICYYPLLPSRIKTFQTITAHIVRTGVVVVLERSRIRSSSNVVVVVVKVVVYSRCRSSSSNSRSSSSRCSSKGGSRYDCINIIKITFLCLLHTTLDTMALSSALHWISTSCSSILMSPCTINFFTNAG